MEDDSGKDSTEENEDGVGGDDEGVENDAGGED